MEGGGRQAYQIRRLYCPNCHAYHRELPDLFTPYKQYGTEEISGVLDGTVTAEDEDSSDYPCETTMDRWKQWFEGNRIRMDGYLKSVGYRLLGFTEELLNSGVSLLERIRSSRDDWLEKILRLIYNSGGRLVPAGIP